MQPVSTSALDLAFELATRPGFDDLHDPNRATALIEAYHDPVGYPTQGFGRLLSRVKWEDLSKYPPITPETAKDWALEDLATAQRAVRRLCPVVLSAAREAALIDFTFNAGGGNLQVSALRQAVLRGDHDGAAAQFGRWIFSSGRKMPGLIRRRAAEAALYRAG